MHQLTLKHCTSTTLTFVWSSRLASQAKEGTVIHLSLFHTEDGKEKRSDSLMHTLPLQTTILAWSYDSGMLCFAYVRKLTSKFPLAFFNTPWVRLTGERKINLDWDISFNLFSVVKTTTILHWSIMIRSIPSLSWLVVRRRLTAPLSIRSCCDSLFFSLAISFFNSSSCYRG